MSSRAAPLILVLPQVRKSRVPGVGKLRRRSIVIPGLHRGRAYAGNESYHQAEIEGWGPLPDVPLHPRSIDVVT